MEFFVVFVGIYIYIWSSFSTSGCVHLVAKFLIVSRNSIMVYKNTEIYDTFRCYSNKYCSFENHGVLKTVFIRSIHYRKNVIR
jgi:hypothetical protein